MLLLKTRKEHMEAVRRSRKHATDDAPRDVQIGDWLLVQVTFGQPGNETRRVKYAMRFAGCYEDHAGESMRTFGQQWRYIIEGSDFRLLHPFDIEDVQVSDKNYGQGVIRFAYVDPRDEAEMLRRGLLEPV